MDFSKNPTGDLLRNSRRALDDDVVLGGWCGSICWRCEPSLDEVNVVLVNDVMMKSWGSGRVCLGQGQMSVLDPADKIPQDENKTKSSHGLCSFSCDSCHTEEHQSYLTPWVRVANENTGHQYYQLLSWKEKNDYCKKWLLHLLNCASVAEMNCVPPWWQTCGNNEVSIVGVLLIFCLILECFSMMFSQSLFFECIL